MDLVLRFLLFATCLTLVSLTSLAILRRLRIEHPLELILGAAVLDMAQAVLALELLSLLGLMRPFPLVLLHGVVAAVALAPPLREKTLLFPLPVRIDHGAAWKLFDRRLAALAALVGVVGLYQLSIAVALPPTNHDSMTYHLARVGYYLQHESLASFPTVNIRQTAFPANAELLILWQILLLGVDRTAALIQWASWALLMPAVYILARRLCFSRNGSLFASLALSTFPQVVLQSTTTQNDLLTAFLIVAAFAFVASAAEHADRRVAHAILAGIALGLAVGVKSTAFFMIPGLLVFTWAHHRAAMRACGFKRLFTAGLLGILACLAFGSSIYLQNLLLYGSLSGPAPFARLHVGPWPPSFSTLWSNAGRIALQMIAPGGFIPLGRDGWLAAVYRGFSDWAFRSLAIHKNLPGLDFPGFTWEVFPAFAAHEDFTWFGPIFGFLGIPLVLWMLLRPGQPTAPRRAMALSALVYLSALVVVLRWQPWHGRLALPLAAIVAPLLGALYPARRSAARSAWTWLLIAICSATLLTSSLFNQSKPLHRLPRMLRQDHATLVTSEKPIVRLAARLLNDLPLAGKRVGLVPESEDELEYLFFGERFERRIVPVRYDAGAKDPDVLSDLDAILFLGEHQRCVLTAEDRADPGRVFGHVDLNEALARVRASAEWVGVFDVDDVAHLFVRPGIHISPAALEKIPDIVTATCAWHEDKWVSNRFCLKMKVNPDKPVLEIQGEFPRTDRPARLVISAPISDQFKVVIEEQPGRFLRFISLTPLVHRFNGRHIHLDLASDYSFIPKRRGGSQDSRELSWLLHDVGLRKISELSDFVPQGTWWPDRWVGQDFSVKIKKDAQRPILELDVELPSNPPTLQVLHKKKALATLSPLAGQRSTRRIDLRQTLEEDEEDFYVTLAFHADRVFNPKMSGQSEDGRDLGWRLHSLTLKPMSPNAGVDLPIASP